MLGKGTLIVKYAKDLMPIVYLKIFWATLHPSAVGTNKRLKNQFQYLSV